MAAMVVQEPLAKLTAPQPRRSVWIGPFEQLVGAGYALLTAERHGIWTRSRRSYHERIRQPLVPRLLQHLATGGDDEVVQAWIAGFYFNAAKQRLVWADERLLRAFGAVPCAACASGPWCNGGEIAKIVEAVKRGVEHTEEQHQRRLSSMSALVAAHDAEGPLRLLRASVNLRKHSVFPEALHEVESRLPERRQMRLACDVFRLLVDSYLELLACFPHAIKAGRSR